MILTNEELHLYNVLLLQFYNQSATMRMRVLSIDNDKGDRIH